MSLPIEVDVNSILMSQDYSKMFVAARRESMTGLAPVMPHFSFFAVYRRLAPVFYADNLTLRIL